ncbi:hypothetical protein H5410_040891 [Solanum commersonii]|uniref:Uncharacterized protein n=1 Tax=Solanum commersonii TaxID=4109 RepID=A0A9J5XQ93_SOLCO|nr:hypothetical protein H5410_040891 [Solanum commersonii]
MSQSGIDFLLQVINYVVEKLALDKPLDNVNSDGTFAPGMHGATGVDDSSRTGPKPWQKHKPSIEILCNNQASSGSAHSTFWLNEILFPYQVLSPEMSLATVRAYIWKKPEDLVLNYRLLPSK